MIVCRWCNTLDRSLSWRLATRGQCSYVRSHHQFFIWLPELQGICTGNKMTNPYRGTVNIYLSVEIFHESNWLKINRDVGSRNETFDPCAAISQIKRSGYRPTRVEPQESISEPNSTQQITYTVKLYALAVEARVKFEVKIKDDLMCYCKMGQHYSSDAPSSLLRPLCEPVRSVTSRSSSVYYLWPLYIVTPRV